MKFVYIFDDFLAIGIGYIIGYLILYMLNKCRLPAFYKLAVSIACMFYLFMAVHSSQDQRIKISKKRIPIREISILELDNWYCLIHKDIAGKRYFIHNSEREGVRFSEGNTFLICTYIYHPALGIIIESQLDKDVCI